MAISFVAAAQAGSIGPVGQVVVNKPSGVLTNDYLVAGLRGSSSGATTDWASSGWLRVGGAFVASSAAARNMGLYVRRIVDHTIEPADYTFTYTGTTGRVAGQIAAFRGVHLSSAIQAASADYLNTTVTNGAGCNSLTATDVGVLVAMGAAEVTAGSTTPAYTMGLTPIGVAASGSAGTQTTVAMAYKAVAAGATGQQTFVWTTVSSANGQALILNPASEPALGDTVFFGTGETATAHIDDIPATILGLPNSFGRYRVADMDADFAAEETVYWAHRGGSVNWGEMTMRAYTNAVFWGARALEVSTWCSTDDVCIMNHDQTLTNTTATTHDIPATASATLLGSAVDQPPGGGGTIGRVESLLEAYGWDRVIVWEEKSYAHTSTMLGILEDFYGSHQEAAKHVIIKCHGAGGTTVPIAARALGYKTWGYFSAADIGSGDLAAKHVNYDYLGFNYDASGPDWTTALSYGKPVVAYVVPNAAAATTVLGKGAHGLQCADVMGIIPQKGNI